MYFKKIVSLSTALIFCLQSIPNVQADSYRALLIPRSSFHNFESVSPPLLWFHRLLPWNIKPTKPVSPEVNRLRTEARLFLAIQNNPETFKKESILESPKSRLSKLAIYSVGGGLLLLSLVLYVWISPSPVIVDPIAVTDSVKQQGLMPDLLAQRAKAQFNNAKQSIVYERYASANRNDPIRAWAPDTLPDIEIPGSKVSLHSVVNIIRSTLGKEPRHLTISVLFDPEDNEKKLLEKRLLVFVSSEGPDKTTTLSEHSIPFDRPQELDMVLGKAFMQAFDPYLLAAYLYVKEDNALAAKTLLEKYSWKGSDQAWAYLLWGTILDSEEHYDEAIAKLKVALRENPRFAQAYNNLGVTLLERGQEKEDKKDINDGLDAYRHAAAVDPFLDYVYINWANDLYKVGKLDEALSVLQKGIDLHVEPLTLWKQKGLLYLYAGKLQSAIDCMKVAAKIDPQDAGTHFQWSDFALRLGKGGEALEQYQIGIALDPKGAESDLGSLENYDLKYQFFMANIKAKVKEGPSYLDWGTYLYSRGQYDQAAPYFRKAIAINPKYPSAHYYLAKILYVESRYRESADEFEMAASLNDKLFQDDFNQWFDALARIGKISELSKIVPKITGGITDHSVLVNFWSANLVDHRLGSYAVPILKRVITEDPLNEYAYIWLERCYVQQKNYTEAIQVFKDGLGVNPNNATLHFELAQLYYSEQKLALAMDNFSRSIAADKDGIYIANASLQIARILTVMKRVKEASGYYQMAVARVNPSSQEAQQIYAEWGSSWISAGYYKEGSREFEKMGPDSFRSVNPLVFKQWQWALIRMKDFSTAIRIRHQLLAIHPEFSDKLYTDDEVNDFRNPNLIIDPPPYTEERPTDHSLRNQA